jgi:hypothetical protein
MLIVIFLPGGIMEGLRRIWSRLNGRHDGGEKIAVAHPQPAE